MITTQRILPEQITDAQILHINTSFVRLTNMRTEESLLSLSELLRQHTEARTTGLRTPVSAGEKKNGAHTLYYLADGGYARQQTPSDCEDRWCPR